MTTKVTLPAKSELIENSLLLYFCFFFTCYQTTLAEPVRNDNNFVSRLFFSPYICLFLFSYYLVGITLGTFDLVRGHRDLGQFVLLQSSLILSPALVHRRRSVRLN